MKKKLLEHPGLKLGALAGAILMWLIITNFNDPIMTMTFSDIPVMVVNSSYVESMGQSYKISDNYDTVDVTVRANRSTVDRLSPTSITATADLSQIISFETDPVMVPTSISIPGVSAANVTSSPKNISIELEDMVSSEFVIAATVGTTRPANGYEVGKLEVSPETLTIRGPGSLVNIIERVTANVDVTLLKKDSDLRAQLKIFDRNGMEFTDAQMSYLTFNVDEREVIVHVTLYKVVSGVTIEVETSGEPAPGYQVSRVTVTPSTVSVVGSEEALEQLAANGNIITISSDSGLISIDGASSDQEFRLDISKLMPNGISLAQDVSSMALVNVQILPYNSKSVPVATKNIQTTGLAEGMNCVFGVNRLEIKVRATDENLESLDANSIGMSVDLTGLPAGTHSVPVAITLPEGCELVEDVTVDAVLSATEINQ